MGEEIEVLELVAQRLDEAGIPYMVTGSMAVAFYAIPRMTRDVDLVVELSVDDTDRLCALLGAAEFYVDPDTVRDAANRHATFNVIHERLIVKVDFLVRKDTDYRRTEFSRRRRLPFEGRSFFVVAPEDLIISKPDWARDTHSAVQLGDVRGLLASVPDLDRAYLEEWIARLGLASPVSRGDGVNDTSPEMEARYRAMLLARSPEERVRMADSMFSSARRLVVASILAADPSASPAAIRRGLFLRFYGHEFDEPKRERVLDRLASPDAGRRVRRQVAVDWDGLGMALTWRSVEHEFFLDVRTGKVRRYRLSTFGGDGEDEELTEDEANEGLAAGHLIRIEPIESSVEYDWMAEFAASVANARLRDRLEQALAGRHPFRRFKDTLAEHPAERERWFRIHDERVRGAIREWLDDNDIEPTTPPAGQFEET